jgi:hypothetical protein
MLDFRVGMQRAASGMGETRDSGRGAGEVADANTWPRSRALATPPQPNFWGRQCGSWGGAGEDQVRVVVRWRIHLVSSCHILRPGRRDDYILSLSTWRNVLL